MKLWVIVSIAATTVLLTMSCGNLNSPEPVSLTQTIGTSGGVLSLQRVEMEIPEGALPYDVDVTIERYGNHPGGNLVPVYRLEIHDEGVAQEGFVFEKPVTLTFSFPIEDLPSGNAYGGLRLAYVEEGAWKILQGSRGYATPSGAGTVTGETDHLSVWSVVIDPGCLTDDDCEQGYTCLNTECFVKSSCDAWEHISEEELAQLDQCLGYPMPPGMESQDYSVVTVEGFLFGEVVHHEDAFYKVQRSDDDTVYEITLPCEELILTLIADPNLSGTEEGFAHSVFPAGCKDSADCDCGDYGCENSYTAFVESHGQGPNHATAGHVILGCDPEDHDCVFLSRCLEEADVEFGVFEGQQEWLKVTRTWVTQEEWTSLITMD